MASPKPGWKRVKFGDIAQCVNDRVDDPKAAGVERYVGLEHLDPESLSIRRWGTPDEVESTKLRFKPGDIIFGKRRAYQRKLAVADFEGICSAHAMVLRAKPNVVLPEFLPFFMQSDLFMDRAVAISVGSLSPTINWKTLAAEEFALPPWEEQRRIAGLAASSFPTWECYRESERAAAKVAQSIIEDTIAASTNRVAIGAVIADIAYGCSQKSSYQTGGCPILRIPNVLREELDLSDLQHIDGLSGGELARYSVGQGDVLLVRTNGNPDYVGRSVVIPALSEPMVYASYLLRVRSNGRILPEYLSLMLNAPTIRQKLRGAVKSSAGNYNINTAGIREQLIPDHTLATQRELVDRVASVTGAKRELAKRLASLHAMQRALLNGVLQ